MRLALVAALLVGAASPGGARTPAIEDDYPRALQAARDGGKLLFIDAWAPW